MRRLLLLLPFLVISIPTHAQSLWTGILNPVSGPGACNPANISAPQACAIDWPNVGVAGGIPNRTTICNTTACGTASAAGTGATLSQINAALSSCPSGQVVLLKPGTYSINGTINLVSNCTLRGAGTLTASGTILNATGTSGAVIQMGTGGPSFTPTSTSISSGATAGSTSIVVASASGISVGTLLVVSELNDPVYVTIKTIQGNCTFCDATSDGGARSRSQIVKVTSVSGTTVTFSPPLYTNYGSATGTGPALVYPFSNSSGGGIHDAGVELLQIFANNTGYSASISMQGCDNCWVKNVEDNYADGDHIDTFWGFHDEIRDSYFSNAYNHSPGGTDADIRLLLTSSSLVENNIFERLHVNVMLKGAAGNVIGYNYGIGQFDSSATSVNLACIDFHGAHPQFNLFEGNICNQMTMDSFWGTQSNNTMFRNNWRGTDTLASPLTTGRNDVNWASTTLASQQDMGEQLAYVTTNANSVGNIIGSLDAVTVTTNGKYNSGTAPFTSTIIPSATRTYDKFFSATSIGYDTGSDTSGSGVASFAGGPSNTTGYWVGLGARTLFQHGNFDIASNSIIWNGSITHTLPASFYKTAKPSWFSASDVWPPIGPDVTGGTIDNATLAGHVYPIPAERCYNSESRDSHGMKLFDPTVCYASTGGGGASANTQVGGFMVGF